MYKISTLLFNIKNNQPNFKDDKVFRYYFPNFDAINYFFSIAKKEDIENIDLNHILENGMNIYQPSKEQLLDLFLNIIYFDHIKDIYFKKIYSFISKDINLNLFKYKDVPSINNFAYHLIFKKTLTNSYNNSYNNLKLYSFKSDNYDDTIKIMNRFKEVGVELDQEYFDFLKNKNNLYIQFKNFDNYFGLVTKYNEFEFEDYELKLNSNKTVAISIASQSLYSLYYAIDLIDHKTKIFIGETQDFDDRNEIVANNFYELLNSEESLLKVYDFMKADTLATEY